MLFRWPFQLAAEASSTDPQARGTSAPSSLLLGHQGYPGSSAEYYWALVSRCLVATRIAVSVGADYKLNWTKDLSPAERSAIHERNAHKLLHLCQVNGGIYIKLVGGTSAAMDCDPVLQGRGGRPPSMLMTQCLNAHTHILRAGATHCLPRVPRAARVLRGHGRPPGPVPRHHHVRD